MRTALIADSTGQAVTPPRIPSQLIPSQLIAAMIRSGTGTMASGLLALVATKILAVMLGAPSVALLETLQQIRQIALVGATANGQTGLVQGASALTGRARREYVRTILCVFAAATLAVAAVMLALRERVAQAAGLPAGSGRLVGMLVAAVVFSSGFVFLSALLNVRGEIGRLAMLQVMAAAVMAAGAWPAAIVVRRGNRGALPVLLGVSALITIVAALRMIRLRRWLAGPGPWWTAHAARHFFSISGVMLATGLTSTVSLLAVRGHMARVAGLEITGQFDAAWAISANHVTLVLAALQTYYLPQLARARSKEQSERQMAAVFPVAILAATPVIVTLAVLRPMVLAALYSSAFQVASAYLRWTLIGDYLKVTAWVVAMPMLAAADMRIFLATDTLVQAVFVGASWALPAARPESAAIGFTLSYGVCLGLSWCYAARHVGFRLTRERALLWLAGFTLVVLAAGSTWNDHEVSLPKAFAWIVTAVGGAAAGAWRMKAGKFRT